jgi:hypothetical protein
LPNLDGTGPLGQGKMTGRRRDRCRDKQTTKTEKSETKSVDKNKSVYGLGLRGGRGRGQ